MVSLSRSNCTAYLPPTAPVGQLPRAASSHRLTSSSNVFRNAGDLADAAKPQIELTDPVLEAYCTAIIKPFIEVITTGKIPVPDLVRPQS